MISRSHHDKRVDALLALAAKAGATTPGVTTSLVWQPGGAAGGNIYTTFASLYAAIQALGEAYYQVSVDTSHGAADIPAGGPYALGNGAWSGASASLATLTIDSGVSFTPAGNILYKNLLVQNNADAAYTITAGTRVNMEWHNAAIFGNAGGPLIKNSGGILQLYAYDGTIVGDGANAIIEGAAGTSFVAVLDQTTLAAGSLAGAVGQLNFSADVSLQTSPVVPAGWTLVPFSAAANEAYSAGAPGNWAVPAPTNVNTAIDRLAAAVEGLLGHAIP